MSGIYEDDLDKADEIIYTGQGGNDLLGNHRQIGSQQLKRGNLALKVGFIY
jgi:[histone H3]-lysine9 N-trimethyltransferase EHMT